MLEEISTKYSGEEVASAKYHFDHALFIKDETQNNMALSRVTAQKKQQLATLKEPLMFDLSTNFPNPFNPTTTISYSIPEANIVHLTVYDNLGREVEQLVNGFKKEGKYEVVFNASKLSSGIYYYKVVSGKYSAVKKMLLLK